MFSVLLILEKKDLFPTHWRLDRWEGTDAATTWILGLIVLCVVSPLSSRSPWHPPHPTVGLLRKLNHQVILFVATVNLLLAEFTTGSGKYLGKGENGMRLKFVQRPLGCTRAQWPSQHCAPCPEGHHHLVFCSVGGYCRELWAAVCPAAWWQGLAVGHGMCEFRLGLFSLGFAAVNCVKH